MRHRGLTLFEVLVIIVVIGILAALLIPPTCGGGIRRAKIATCASNLRQLYHLGTIYASNHKEMWPEAKGSALWLSFVKMSPPLIQTEELEVLLCPIEGNGDTGECDYLGPRKRWSELGLHDALAGDKPGNHGEGYEGNVLLKDGSMVEYEFSHPIWDTLAP